MTEKEAIYILRNAAWLGSDADRQKVEEAVEVVANAIEAQDMTLYMNLPEVSAEEAVEILKRNNRIELLPSGKDTNVPSKDCIDRAEAQTAIQFAARRYTVAHEAHGEGHVVWSDNLISVTDAMNALREVPSAQPEIVRCKDCGHWDTTWQNDFAPNYHYCSLVDGTRRGDFFCADAERRGEQDEID